MDRLIEKQKEIYQRLVKATAHYPALWSKMIEEWNQPDPGDRVWLTYSANYLFRTNNIRWAIDPLTLNWRVNDAPKVDVIHDLNRLSFVLLTHGHSDHLDIDLLSVLRDSLVTWIVPDFILSKVVRQAGLLRKNMIVPSHLVPIQINGINILPFNGLHWETLPDGSRKGVPAMGYLIESGGKHWLFPGDTRTYDVSQLPAFGSLDVVFAHLWLGRGSALMDEPPLLEAFCRFFLDLRPRRLILTHLTEFGRDANDYWDESHVQVVFSKLEAINSGISVISAGMGESVLL